MRRLWLDGMKALLRGAVETLAAFPLLLLLLFALESRRAVMLWAASMALEYALGFMLRRRFCWRRTGVLIGVSFLLSAAFALIFRGMGPGAWVGAALGTIWMYRGMRSWDRSWHVEFPIIFHWTAVFAYFIGSFLCAHLPSLSAYGPLLTSLGLFYVVLVLWMTNEELIHTESLSHWGRTGAAGTVRRQNRLLVLAVIAVWLLAGAFGRLRRACAWLGRRLADGLSWLKSLLDSLNSDSPAGAPTPLFPMETPPMEPPEPSPFWEALYRILSVVVLCAVVVALLWLLYISARRAIRLLRLLYAKLTAYLSGHAREEDTGYVDESVRLLDIRQTAGAYLDRIKRRLARPAREPGWDELKDNRERARFLFRRLVRRHVARGYEYKRHLTPLETSAELSALNKAVPDASAREIGRLYTKARYGAGPISDAEIAAVRRETGDLKPSD